MTKLFAGPAVAILICGVAFAEEPAAQTEIVKAAAVEAAEADIDVAADETAVEAEGDAEAEVVEAEAEAMADATEDAATQGATE